MEERTTVGATIIDKVTGFDFAGPTTFYGAQDSIAIEEKVVKSVAINKSNFKISDANCRIKDNDVPLMVITHIRFNSWLNKGSKVQLSDTHGNRVIYTITKDLKEKSIFLPIFDARKTMESPYLNEYFDLAMVPGRKGSVNQFVPKNLSFDVSYNLEKGLK